MSSLEMLDFRLNDFEKTLSSFDRTLSQIHLNQEKILKRSEEMFTRVTAVEKTIEEGRLKSYILKVIRESYPLVLIGLFCMHSVDQKKIVSAMESMDSTMAPQVGIEPTTHR